MVTENAETRFGHAHQLMCTSSDIKLIQYCTLYCDQSGMHFSHMLVGVLTVVIGELSEQRNEGG